MNKADVKKNRNAIVILALILMLNAAIDVIGIIARTFFNQPTVYTLQAEQKVINKKLKEHITHYNLSSRSTYVHTLK